MFDQRVFEFMEKFFKEYDYPLIHSMSCEQIADIYHISNRCFLVSWLLKLHKYQDLEEYIFEHDTDEAQLANLVCGYGFCSDKEKLGFMNGGISPEDQLKIIYRMCKFISHYTNSPKPEETNPITLDKLTDFVHLNLNLFPQYGEIKTLSKEEKLAKVVELEKELESLKNPEGDQNDDDDGFKLAIDRDRLKEHIDELVGESDKMLTDFHKAVIGVNKGRDWSKVGYKMNHQAGDKIATCLRYVETISKHIMDLKTITEFSAENEISNKNTEYAEMISDLYKQTKRRPY